MASYVFKTFQFTSIYSVISESINDSGQVVGEFSEGVRKHGFLFDGTTSDVVQIDYPGAKETYLSDINASGQVVGSGFSDYSHGHGFVRDPTTGAFTTIDAPGAVATVLTSINDHGEVGGYYFDTNGTAHSFVENLSTGVLTQINPPGEFSHLIAINNSGQAVGVYVVGEHYLGFIDDIATGEITTFDPPGSTETEITGINDAGEFVGYHNDGQMSRAFVDDPATGKLTIFEQPGAANTSFTAINNEGQITGRTYATDGTSSEGFVYDEATGAATEVHPSGSAFLYLNSINDAGQIAGSYYTPHLSQDVGFVGTPSNAPPCFCKGTLILTDRGEIPVEQLAIGDRVVTASGAQRPITWIGRRSYSGRYANSHPEVLPIRFAAASLSDGVPARDLAVSPKHAMLIDGLLIPAEHLINGATIKRAERVDEVHYFHVELDRHDVILAETAPTESFVDDGGRATFENALEFAVRYPDAIAAEARYCAPRVEDGFQLHEIRRRLTARAGLPQAPALAFGSLRGRVEQIDKHVVRGWAQNQLHPDGPVCLDLVLDGTVVAQVLADRFRADLRRAGIGDGCHAFEARLAVGALDRGAQLMEVRRSVDGAVLANHARVEQIETARRAA